tara:strand:- start:54 stop:863 length:810 start_codon:yes stop_codon:yes gene_type:complete
MAEDPFEGHRVLAFDLETTGLDTRRDRIVQYALVGSDEQGGSVTVDDIVNPQCKIPTNASSVHGIFDEDVKGKGVFGEHADRIHDLIDGSVIVGHNIERYDWPLLTAEFARLGRLSPKPHAMIDTLRLAKRLRIPGRHDLGTLCRGADISLNKAHDAAADAGATLLLLWRWIAKHPQHFRRSVTEIENWITTGDSLKNELGPGLDDLEPVEGTGGRLRRNGEQIIICFGKHKSREIRVIAQEDPGYIRWLCSPASPLNTDAKELIREIL